MSKSVTYSVVPRKNLLKKDEPAKYYAQAQASGDVEVKEMAKRIEKACTVTRADVMAVLIALEDTIVEGHSRSDCVAKVPCRKRNIVHRSSGKRK